MPRNFNFEWKGVTAKDPRVVMRAIIGLLLAANLVAAVIAFKPFGGSAEDLRRQTEMQRSQLARAQANLANTRKMVEKVQAARTQGDQFMTKYVQDRRTMASTILEEINQLATQAGIKAGQEAFSPELVEGSDTISMLSISVGFEGTYASLAKLVNLLDRSPRFLIVENMVASAPQSQTGQAAGQADKALNVTLRIDTFVRDESGAGL
ncbi:Fimbrial assembly family protein [Candidatus Sulfopaludibacter sp. SbA4]|nr:Fimbrial assembly family protein [Candidatus Sulfopaludibacter sp. SbA4]